MTTPSQTSSVRTALHKNISNAFSGTSNVSANGICECEAYDCKRQAITQIDVNVGVFGQINLNLCNLCLPKFSASAVNVKSTNQNKRIRGNYNVSMLRTA